jgi:hypothetical protein
LRQIRNSIEKKPHHSIAYSALLFFSLFMGWLSLLAGIRVNIPLDREKEREREREREKEKERERERERESWP